jgi:hypothetical protein
MRLQTFDVLLWWRHTILNSSDSPIGKGPTFNTSRTIVPPDRPPTVTEVMWATIPFLITMIVALLTITYVPASPKSRPRCRPTIRRAAAASRMSRNATDDPDAQIIVVTEVPLVSSDGTPVKTKAGAPIVNKLTDCAASTDKDSCRELFLNVSSCKISPPAPPTPASPTPSPPGSTPTRASSRGTEGH